MIHFPRYNPNEQLLMLVIADATTIAANPSLFVEPMDYVELPVSGTTDPVSVRGAPFSISRPSTIMIETTTATKAVIEAGLAVWTPVMSTDSELHNTGCVSYLRFSGTGVAVLAQRKGVY